MKPYFCLCYGPRGSAEPGCLPASCGRCWTGSLTRYSSLLLSAFLHLRGWKAKYYIIQDSLANRILDWVLPVKCIGAKFRILQWVMSLSGEKQATQHPVCWRMCNKGVLLLDSATRGQLPRCQAESGPRTSSCLGSQFFEMTLEIVPINSAQVCFIQWFCKSLRPYYPLCF